ncbi:hypothetical protein NE686_17970 [Tissierella carlieri]|uniref:Uncharacterized protein n=1 Tax=Tissierella carlieri TaxID=689904 RepID=A0ABT1SES1_9FIRM|nr:hypothetical protein [Tissierella carlieri]MCQ4924993.1 hypothetical protein [Tissierella carlieri]
MSEELINAIWAEDSRNSNKRILSDYFNGFRLLLKPYKTGYKFYVAIRRHKKHGIGDDLTSGTPVAYFKDCELEQAKIKAIEHFRFMIA